ncbi:MAG: SUF system NifU family Fe-S cluster assembly protein [Armatimonadetes bacterium]|nr:SUF system NifU family Fe-S cluster assembly protein [Armatimonadota bacterium]
MSFPHEREALGDDLYREIILDHYARPRHRGPLKEATHTEEGINPTCGDAIELHLQIRDGKIEGVGFEGHGCSISMASASMLADMICGKDLEYANELTQSFKKWMLEREQKPDVELGELEALEGVRRYPVRIKCALLAWNTFLQVLRAQQTTQEELDERGEQREPDR